MAWLNFSVMTIWSAMTPAGGMLPTWRRDDGKFVGDIVGVSFGSDGVSRRHHRSPRTGETAGGTPVRLREAALAAPAL